MVRALVSHQCGQVGILVSMPYALSFLLVLFFAPFFFCILLAVFSTPPKPRFLNADSSILSMVDEEQLCGLLPLNRYLFIYWNRLHVLCLAPQWETSILLNLKWPMKNWEKKLYFFFWEILIAFSHSPVMPWFGESSDHEKIFFSGLSLPWAVYSLEKST